MIVLYGNIQAGPSIRQERQPWPIPTFGPPPASGAFALGCKRMRTTTTRSLGMSAATIASGTGSRPLAGRRRAPRRRDRQPSGLVTGRSAYLANAQAKAKRQRWTGSRVERGLYPLTSFIYDSPCSTASTREHKSRCISNERRFLTEGILVVIDPAQDSRHDVDVSPQRLQIAPHGDERAGDPIQVHVVGNLGHVGSCDSCTDIGEAGRWRRSRAFCISSTFCDRSATEARARQAAPQSRGHAVASSAAIGDGGRS